MLVFLENLDSEYFKGKEKEESPVLWRLLFRIFDVQADKIPHVLQTFLDYLKQKKGYQESERVKKDILKIWNMYVKRLSDIWMHDVRFGI